MVVEDILTLKINREEENKNQKQIFKTTTINRKISID